MNIIIFIFYLINLGFGLYQKLEKSSALDILKNSKRKLQTRYYDFEITEGIIAPDGYEKLAVLINNQFPGPEIICNSGDTIIVKVRNMMQNQNFSLHYHGIDQKGSVNNDGVPFVTQYPISPNTEYVYTFNVNDQAGTYWYHAHTSLHDDTAYGTIIVKEDEGMLQSLFEYNNQYQYSDERTLLLSDNFHESTTQQYNKIFDNNFQTVGVPNSILTNGQTKLDQSQLTTSPYKGIETNSKYNSGYHILNVEQNKRYRIRIICASTYSFLRFQIANHDFYVIEVDGVYVEPILTNRVDINSGQRYSIILETNKPINQYWMKTNILYKPGPNNGYAVLNYVQSSTDEIQKTYLVPNITGVNTFGVQSSKVDKWIIEDLSVSKWYSDSDFINIKNGHVYEYKDLKVTKNYFFNFTEQRKGNRTNFLVNEVVYQDPEMPILNSLIKNNSYDNNFNNGVYEITEGDVVQVVLQNMATIEGECLQHPWHLHGHPFYVVAMGDGLYSNVNIQPFANPVLRDTTTLYPSMNNSMGNIPNGPCGWQVIRFKADNPGAWIMHCHITEHMLMGMRVVFIEKPAKPNGKYYLASKTYETPCLFNYFYLILSICVIFIFY